jgi:hypothetical protein
MRSIYAVKTLHDGGDALNIPVVLVPENLQDVVTAITAWTRNTGTAALRTSNWSNESTGLRYAYPPPSSGLYTDFSDVWKFETTSYQNYTPFSNATDQKEVSRKLMDYVRLKPRSSTEGMLSKGVRDDLNFTSLGERTVAAVNRYRKTVGLPPRPDDGVMVASTKAPDETLAKSLGTSTFHMFATRDLVMMGLPLPFLLVTPQETIEQAVNAEVIRYNLTSTTLNQTPQRAIYEDIFSQGARLVTDLYNGKNFQNELTTVFNRQDKLGMGGAVSFLADVLTKKVPILNQNKALTGIVKNLGKKGDAALGKTKIGAISNLIPDVSGVKATTRPGVVGRVKNKVEQRRIQPASKANYKK